ncbi:MAG: S8 family serine peptidase [Candidatus Sericytochromatia bacterium]|nr:S8 family serine peptidase [Candidatus Sericytochromatia bacterium]
MKKRVASPLLLLLAGCTVAPQLPAARLAVGEVEAPAVAPRTTPAAVAGYGLATLGARELIVQFAPHAADRTPSRGAFVRRLRTGGELWVLDSEAELRAELEALWQDPDVLLAEPNVRAEPFLTPADPLVSGQWWVSKVGLPAAWDRPQGLGDAAVVVAVVDSGVDLDHPDLAPNLAPGGFDFVDNDADPTDRQGHGTHVAGIIAAAAGNGLGGVGAAPGCKILPIRAGDATLLIADVADGVMHAVQQGAQVINLSLGSPSDSPTLRAAVDQAALAGVLVVAAAGNSNVTSPFYPAAYEAVLAVGATTSTDARASFSNHGLWVELAAPGVDILSTTFDGGYGLKSGTSMACPLVAGAAALLKSVRPTWTTEQLELALKRPGARVTGFKGNAALKRLDVPKVLAALPPKDAPPKLGPPLASPSTTICTIATSANEPVQAALTIGTTSSLTGATTLTLPAGTSRPTFSLSGLVPNTVYYYKITARDAANNGVSTATLRFTTAGPKIKVLTAKPGLYGATLAWTTSTPTTRRVEVGPSESALAVVASMTGARASSHEVSLRDLVPGRTYHYRVSGTAADGSDLAPRVGRFRTVAFTAKAGVKAVTPTSAALGIQLAAAGTLEVRYGLSRTALTQVVQGGAAATGHIITVPGLRPATPYFFQVRATDARGNVAVSPVLTTKTMPLDILEFSAASVTAGGATLQCHTTLPVTVQLRLGLSPAQLTVVGSSTSPTTRFAAPLSGLAPGTTYHAQLVVTDSAGNTQTSSVISFTTLP